MGFVNNFGAFCSLTLFCCAQIRWQTQDSAHRKHRPPAIWTPHARRLQLTYTFTLALATTLT